MAKKILAVVLAVMVAISAMAVNVFAEDQKINVYPVPKDSLVSGQGFSKSITTSFTFDVPVYPQFGYMDSNPYMVFTLPVSFNNDILKINWTLIVNGAEYSLRSVSASDISNPTTLEEGQIVPKADQSPVVSAGKLVSKHIVRFGYTPHNYNSVTNDTTIPQSIAYGDYSSVRLVATLTIKNSGGYNQWYDGTDVDAFKINSKYPGYKGDYAYLCMVQFYNGKDDTEIAGSSSFIHQWNPNKTIESDNQSENTYGFVTAEWNTNYVSVNNWNGTWSEAVSDADVNILAWDHTLANKAKIYGSSADTVKFIVELDNPIVGQATYTLWARTDVRSQANWWQYNGARTYVDEFVLDGKADKLEFDVPLSVLYEATNYGTYNQQLIIFENITLLNTMLMNDYIHFNTVWTGGTAIDQGVYANQSLGKLHWNWNNNVNYQTAPGTYEQVRYCAGGITTSATLPDGTANSSYVGDPSTYNYYTDTVGGSEGPRIPAEAVEMYFLIPGEEAADVPTPEQGTENEEDTENVDDDPTPEVDVEEEDTTPADPAPAPAEDNNPTTGIALAVLPMILSAAAAVISKKH